MLSVTSFSVPPSFTALDELCKYQSVERRSRPLVAPSQMNSTACTERNAPGVTREPGVLADRGAVKSAIHRVPKTADLEEISLRVDELVPMMSSAASARLTLGDAMRAGATAEVGAFVFTGILPGVKERIRTGSAQAVEQAPCGMISGAHVAGSQQQLEVGPHVVQKAGLRAKRRVYAIGLHHPRLRGHPFQ